MNEGFIHKSSYVDVAGVPARQIGWVCECEQVLDAALRCPDCRKIYCLKENELKIISPREEATRFANIAAACRERWAA